ncbi:MAG TPA: DUF4230 domain-containing protein [Leptolyngbyaceae cyanobacterium M33_DOE_097]|uniref:DUF4230 domain-containing protein n=1 Tax=Oscillatoriales cyanobacterium SpSt-418 TaxID=2282169 RepID=A0A7C3PG70_9CYAN|nr:DUF4230 domain-containing protein [Leptolyngbyaceae cyanobacterium M33_DOE_097]
MQEQDERGVGVVLRNLSMMLAGGLIAATAVGSFWAVRMGDRLLSSAQNFLNAPPPSPQVDVRSIVIEQVREASDLTTAVFSMQAVVPTSQDVKLGNFTVGTTKLLYIAHGQVQAGVDLSQIRASDAQISGNSIQFQIPAPRILDSKVDVNRSSVYDYNRGFLNLGPDVAPDLQTAAQKEALTSIVRAACDDGILQRAGDRAKQVVTRLLTTAGYTQVNVTQAPPVSASCVASAQSSPNPAPTPANPAPSTAPAAERQL